MSQTNIREQMRQVIQSGIEGWIDAQFSGDNQPTDSINSYYPLQRDMVIVYYHSQYPYQLIEDAYLQALGDTKELDNQQLQAWIEYHWQYAYLELAERFDIPVIELTEDMQERRKQLRDEILERGYKLVDK